LAREKLAEGVEAAKRLERHLEAIATKVATKDTMTHLVNAGSEAIQAANAALKHMEVPKETKARIHRAEKEVLLAMKSAIDAVLEELDKELAPEKAELRKIEIKRKKSK